VVAGATPISMAAHGTGLVPLTPDRCPDGM